MTKFVALVSMDIFVLFYLADIIHICLVCPARSFGLILADLKFAGNAKSLEVI